MKSCTYCGKQYSDEAVSCIVDGQPLQPAAPSVIPVPVYKHSAMGLASFTISIAVGVLLVIAFTVAAALSGGQVSHDHQYPGQVVVGMLIIALLAADVVAIGLGVATFFEARKKCLFGVLGLVFASLTVMGTVALILVGLYLMDQAH